MIVFAINVEAAVLEGEKVVTLNDAGLRPSGRIHACFIVFNNPHTRKERR